MNPRCLIVDNDEHHAAELSSLARKCGFTVDRLDTAEITADTEMEPYDVVMIELSLDHDNQSGMLLGSEQLDSSEVFVMSDVDAPEAADKAIRLGASYYFCKPFSSENLAPMLEDIAAEASEETFSTDESTCEAVDQFGMLRGSSRGMRKLYRQIRKVAQTDASVLVVGESGTGKELVAHTTHLLSPRRSGPYVAFNCAAVPAGLAESELFGHEKGAFSGATQQHRGYFERASGGTILLDEITEMDMDLQAKLLRVLETHSLRRLGSEKNIALDVRVISACNRSPDEAVQDGKLREDLYYRLAQFPVRVPPLRRRGRDVIGLSQYFLRELNERHSTSLFMGPDADAAIAGYHWPGNVRELKHLLERAYIMSESSIDRELLQAIGEQENSLGPSGDGLSISPGTTIAEMERRLILATLEHTQDDKAAAAEMLGVSLKTLYNRLKSYSEQP